MNSPEALALLAAFLFGTGTTLSKLGLSYVSPRTGALISLPATALMFWAAAPFQLNLTGVSAQAVGLFAVIGVFFPALVSLLNFEATQRMGPTVSSAVNSTSAAFALLTAILFLNEPFTPLIGLGTLIIIAGVVAMSWDSAAATRQWATWVLLIPLAGAAVRGNSQSLMKYALGVWPNPFAAGLIGYTVAAIVVWLFSRWQKSAPVAFDRRAVPWFTGVGFCNGSALFLTYLALQDGQIGVVAPIVTTAPLFTLILGWLFLRDERFDWRIASGVIATVLGVILILTH